MTVLRWTDQAVEDLRSIRLFIERDSPRYGRAVAERLYDATSQLELFPYSGRMLPEVNREDLRELIVGDYHIVYRVDSEAVFLLTIYRSSRIFPHHLFDE